MTIDGLQPRQSLVEAAVGSIANWLKTGAVEPGGRLPSEADFARRLGVSRPVVREAVARLRADGLIEARQGSGLYLSQYGYPTVLRISRWEAGSLDNVRQIFQLRRYLEAGAAELAARHRSKADLQRIERALEVQRVASDDGVREDLAFHFAVAHASKNDYFFRTLEFLSGSLAGAIRPTEEGASGFASRKRAVEREHLWVFTAIRDGPAEEAAEAMRSHLDHAWRRISTGETDAERPTSPGRIP